jgi:hypothetical protein
MARTTTNALLDATAASLFIAMAATGFVLWFVLPPGSGKTWILWSLERHDWALLHAIVSAALLVVLVAHVTLHWKWLTEVIGRRLPGRRVSGTTLAIVVLGSLVVLAAAFGISAFAMRTHRGELDECASGSSPSTASTPSFARDIAPLLAERCVDCHGSGRAQGGVRLDDYAHVMAHVVKGAPRRSRIVQVLEARRDGVHRADAETLDLLVRWVADGASE